MRLRRFDKQLQFVFMVLSGLTVVVGLAAIGVNRLLVNSQEQMLAESISVIQTTERVGRDVDRAGGLVEQLLHSKTEEERARNSSDLAAVITTIEAGSVEMRRFLMTNPDSLKEVEEARRLAENMTKTADRVDRLDTAMQAEKLRLNDGVERLSALTSAGTDLARLRVTANIWQLYSAPAAQNPRPLLDHLADKDFFAFERLVELSNAAATLSRLVQQVADAHRAEEVSSLQAMLEDTLLLARARTSFLPSYKSAEGVRDELSAFARSNLVALRQEHLSALNRLSTLSSELKEKLAFLAEDARVGRSAMRRQMQVRTAEAAWWATILTGALAAITLVAVFMGYLVWSRARHRVVLRLGSVADRMVKTARGETGEAMKISGHDEIGQLEKALNVLRRRTDEALRLRRSLESAVLARTADVVAEMELANRARAEAEELSGAKTHFLARMSHEIRTPLTGVIGLLDLLVADEADPRRRTRLETALTSARDLQAMTEDILSFSIGEESRAHEVAAAFDPSALARGLGDHLRVLAQPKGLTVDVRIPDDLPDVLFGDPGRIRQILFNLISNAVKYTNTGNVRLTVSGRSTAADGLFSIEFAVEDTGPGMTAEETRRAFDVYGRTAEVRRKGLPGVGLGLAIVRQLTDAMGGELRISTAPGAGSSFTLALRLPAGTAAALAEKTGSGSDFVLTGQHFTGLRVLVVDDYPVNQLVARGYLELMGCTVAQAATGGEALTIAASSHFDFILIDLDLPDMRGEEVVQRIHSTGARLAVFTADQITDDPETRARLGVDHVLTKPLSPRALAAMLSESERTEDPPPPDQVEAALRDDMASLGADLSAQIVSAFLSDLADGVHTLLDTTDMEERRRVAHRLKGAASNFGLQEFCALLQRIEKGDATALKRLTHAAEGAETRLRAVASQIGLQVTVASAKQ